MALSAVAVILVACLVGSGRDGVPEPGSQPQQTADSVQSPPSDTSLTDKHLANLEQELKAALAGAKRRIQLDPSWAWAPASNDEKRFPFFKKHNESRWNLELDSLKIPAGTVYEQTEPTEEGGAVSEYLIFGKGEATWWFDGRQDKFSEFKNPSIRKMKVVRLFLAVHDGKSDWLSLEKDGKMPLDHGLSIGIELQDWSRRYW